MSRETSLGSPAGIPIGTELHSQALNVGFDWLSVVLNLPNVAAL